MARGIPQYTTGTLPLAGTATLQTDAFLVVIENALTAYQSNSIQAWTLYDDIDPLLASRHRIYKSVGDRNLVGGAGDTALFTSIRRTTATIIAFQAYQDWSDLSSTGSRLNGGGGSMQFTPTSAELNYWIFVNEYELQIVTQQSTIWGWSGWFSPVRSHIASNRRGVAFTTAAATAGSSVVVSLDRDISSDIVLGQTVWTQNVTASGNALESETIQILEVEAITPTTITLSLTENLASGALIGSDPAPLCSYVTQSGNALNIGGTIPRFTNTPNGLYLGLNLSSPLMQSDFNPQLLNITEGEIDPQLGSNLYKGCKAAIQSTTANSSIRAPRGETGIMSLWAQGAQADPNTDIMFDVATNTNHKYFSSMIMSNFGFAFRIP